MNKLANERKNNNNKEDNNMAVLTFSSMTEVNRAWERFMDSSSNIVWYPDENQYEPHVWPDEPVDFFNPYFIDYCVNILPRLANIALLEVDYCVISGELEKCVNCGACSKPVVGPGYYPMETEDETPF